MEVSNITYSANYEWDETKDKKLELIKVINTLSAELWLIVVKENTEENK